MYTFRDAQPGDEAGVQLVVDTVLREFGMVLDTPGTDSDLTDIHAHYAARGGAFRVLVDSAGQIVGCGGLLSHGPRHAEIRKMYLLPVARGHGLGRSLLQNLVDTARANGVQRLTLETKSVLREAIALYQSFGFTEVANEHHTPRCDRAFALDLVSAPTGDLMNERSLFITFWTNESKTTRNVLAKIPEGSDYRPDPKSRTAHQIAWQIVCEEKMIIEALESGKAEWAPPPMPATMKEVVDAYEKQSATMPGRWEKLPDAKWDGMLEFFGSDRPASPMAWSFLFDIVHHRGQITTYLRPMGSTVPQIYGPSGDEP